MASLSDLYSAPSATPQAITEFGINRQAGYAAEDTGLRQGLLKRAFETRTLPDLVDRQAGRGAFFSSATTQFADRAKEDYSVEQADSQRLLQRTMADLASKRIMASLGVSV